MDSFYASIEMRDNPELKDKPVVVGAGENVEKGYGAVSTCNYKAREFGIRSGQRLATVRKNCPDCVIIPPRMSYYKEVSSQIMDLLSNFVDYEHLEIVSVDEAYLDISNIVNNFEDAKDFGMKIKKEINNFTGLTCSVGIAPSKPVAKIAAGTKKPDGLTVILPEDQKEFLGALPVKKISGIGKVHAEKLKTELGIETIGQLASFKDLEKLKQIFGKKGLYFYNVANGIDDTPVRLRSEKKSISKQKTFLKSIEDQNIVKKTLDDLSEIIYNQLKKLNIEFKTVTINVPFDFGNVHSRSITLKNFTNSLDILKKTAFQIWDLYFSKDFTSIRRIALKISNLIKIVIKQKDLTFWFTD